MTFPYRVTVKNKSKDNIDIKITPQPVASKEEFIMVVAGRFQKAITDPGIRNTLLGRNKLRAELEEILADFHKQGIIKPKEDE